MTQPMLQRVRLVLMLPLLVITVHFAVLIAISYRLLSLLLFLGLLIYWYLAAVALIPLFIGIGKLIVWRINRNATEQQAD